MTERKRAAMRLQTIEIKKTLKAQLDFLNIRLDSRERSLAATKLEESIMWLEKELKQLE